MVATLQSSFSTITKSKTTNLWSSNGSTNRNTQYIDFFSSPLNYSHELINDNTTVSVCWRSCSVIMTTDKCLLVSLTPPCHYLMSISDSIVWSPPHYRVVVWGFFHYEVWGFVKCKISWRTGGAHHITTQIVEKNGSSGSGLTVINSRNLNMIISYE